MITPQPGGALYEQLAARLRKDILSGKLRPGQPLPSERTLQQEYGLARETVRRALGLLRNEGLLASRRGHAVEVKEQPERQNLTVPAGASVIARMPTPEERAELDLEAGVPVLWVVHPDGTSEVHAADQWQIRFG
jgi:DNA-binding FadR family transcriptional regulator